MHITIDDSVAAEIIRKYTVDNLDKMLDALDETTEVIDHGGYKGSVWFDYGFHGTFDLDDTFKYDFDRKAAIAQTHEVLDFILARFDDNAVSPYKFPFGGPELDRSFGHLHYYPYPTHDTKSPYSEYTDDRMLFKNDNGTSSYLVTSDIAKAITMRIMYQASDKFLHHVAYATWCIDKRSNPRRDIWKATISKIKKQIEEGESRYYYEKAQEAEYEDSQ